MPPGERWIAARRHPRSPQYPSSIEAPCVLASRRPTAPLRRGPFRQALLASEPDVPVENLVAGKERDDATEREERPERDCPLPRGPAVPDEQHGSVRNAAMKPTSSATVTASPKPAPRKAASFTSPMPIPRGYARAMRKRTSPAPSPARSHPTLGSSIVRATRITTAPGSTTRFGIKRSSRSVLVITTSTQQKTEAIRASRVKPNSSPAPAARRDVAAVTRSTRRESGACASRGSRAGAFVAMRSAIGPATRPSTRPTTPAPRSTGSQVQPAYVASFRAGSPRSPFSGVRYSGTATIGSSATPHSRRSHPSNWGISRAGHQYRLCNCGAPA